MLLASGMGAIITSTLSKEALDSWGWRLAFIVAALLGLVGLWLRSSVEETDSFVNAKARSEASGEKRANSVFTMFVKHP